MTISLAQHSHYQAALDRRIAAAHRLRRERIERHLIPPTACAIDEAIEAELDRIAPHAESESEVNERRAKATREGVKRRDAGTTLTRRIIEWCAEHVRPDGSIDRAELYDAFAPDDAKRRAKLSDIVYDLRREGRLPYRMDRLRRGAYLRRKTP